MLIGKFGSTIAVFECGQCQGPIVEFSQAYSVMVIGLLLCNGAIVKSSGI